MKLHYIVPDTGAMHISDVKFGASLKGLHINNSRPNYITVDKSEFEESTMTEKQMLLYINTVKTSMTFGGKLYLEVADYGE